MLNSTATRLVWPMLVALLALVLRIEYQNHSIVDTPVRADAAEYFWGAYNLYAHHTYANQPAKPHESPQPAATRTPGYSLFLLPFFYASTSIEQFIFQVATAQALLGTLSVLLTYILARQFLPNAFATLTALFVAISPHLITMEGYLLTETLFTLLLLLGLILLIRAWRCGQARWLIAAGSLFGLLALVKPAALLLGIWLGLFCFFSADGHRLRLIWHRWQHYLIFMLGLLLTFSPFLIRNAIVLGQPFPEEERGWVGVVAGHYPDLAYGAYHDDYPYRHDPEYPRMEKDRPYFWEIFYQRIMAAPLDYLRWYLGGKVIYSWRWETDSYNGLYTYPMIKGGFEEQPLLYYTAQAMKISHWPLWILAFLGSGLLLWRFITGQLPKNEASLLLIVMVLAYFALLVTAFFPAPRYTIPLRPYLYLLAIWFLMTMIRGVTAHLMIKPLS